MATQNNFPDQPRFAFHILTLVVALTATVLLAAACIRPEPQAATLLGVNSQVQGGGNQLLAGMERGALLIEVNSETGIGKATITMTAGLPVTATLRLHLTGLEHLQLSSQQTTITAQVASTAPHAVSQSVAAPPASAANAAQLIAANHPLWLTIEPATTTKPYFTVIVPAAFLTATEGTFTLEWVDFYR